MCKHKQWYLGFFALFSLNALPGLLAGEWGQAVWLTWLVWLLFFFVDDNSSEKKADQLGGERDGQEQE